MLPGRFCFGCAALEPRTNGASELHAIGRLGSGFDLMEARSRTWRRIAAVMAPAPCSEPPGRGAHPTSPGGESLQGRKKSCPTSRAARVERPKSKYSNSGK